MPASVSNASINEMRTGSLKVKMSFMADNIHQIIRHEKVPAPLDLSANCFHFGRMKKLSPSLSPLIELTASSMEAVDALILERTQSEVEFIPMLAEHLIKAGGKRVRPLLTVAAAELSGEIDARAIKIAASVEFIHTATLLHDDVIDASTKRRGIATANHLWGNKASVLVGDFLFARAFELLVEVEDINVLGKLASASAVIAAGEISQMLLVGKPESSPDEYLEVIIGKTAELFAVAAETGAMVSGANAEAVAIMRSYGKAFGIAFQIADDALDYRADEATLGKMMGDDFSEGKITLPVILAWQRGDETERDFWRRCLTEKDLREGDLKEAQTLLAKHNAIEDALLEAQRYADEAVTSLNKLPKSDLRDALIEAVLAAVVRER